MVRIVAIGDPHLRDDQFSSSKKLVSSLLSKVAELCPDGIVVLGDTLHTHSTVKISSLALAERLFRGLKEIAPLVVLIGNHDITHNQIYLPDEETPEHPFIFLKEWENVTVCDRATLFQIKEYTFCGVPYVPPGLYEKAIRDIPIEKVSAFFSHQQFRGVRAHLNQEQLDGDIWRVDFPINICGHFHEAQTIGDNIVYVGTPQQQDAGEDDKKAIGLFTFSQESISLSKRIGSVYVQYDRHPLKGVIKRKTFRIQSDDLKSLESIASFAEKDDYVVKIQISGTANELATLRKNTLYQKIAETKNITCTPLVGEEKIVPCFKSFLEQVHSKLESDPEAKKCFEMLFT